VKRSPDKYVPSAPKDALLSFAMILAFWAVFIGIDVHRFGDPVSVNMGGIQWALAWTATLVGGLLIGAIIGATERFGRLVWSTFLTLTLIYGMAYGFALLEERPLERVLDDRPFAFILIGALMGGVVGEHWYGRAGILTYILAPLAFLGAFLFAQDGLDAAPILDREQTEARVAPDLTPEQYASAQGPLLQAQIAALDDGRDGKPQLFALLVGGYADQSVFLNEVEGVRAILASQFGARSRSIALVNSLAQPVRYPEVSWDNLTAATEGLSGKMGPEDVLFLFLTSHGKEDGFGLTFHPAAGRDGTGMRAQDLAGLLERYYAGPAIVVISSCKSGSFIDDFSGPDRLVITASAADRNSFGCRDGARWTDFGRYFFDVSLRAEADPRKAFVAAVPLIQDAEWWRPWADASQPQISEGAEVGAVLDRLLAATGSEQD
jgi:hypothetical protein